ncbi:deoxycytidylate deaminase [Plesiomonas shigelloides]|uniref:deoxycytidylate deaminase n=1 Tax=Plesiomonas shigelloides TaxID=703 RepID=UPI001E6015C1|nr:deaminase [Plesiomonas shigelloides]
MNVSVLKELLKNKYHVMSNANERELDGDVALDVIKKIIDNKGEIKGLDHVEYNYFDQVINTLYQDEIKTKIKWRNRMIDLAKHVAQWSRDNSKVGAVLVSKKGGDITLGYNGFPFGVKDDERYNSKDKKLNIIVHAEVNAIIAAGSRAADGHLYVVGKPICARCAGPIIQSGIKRVFAEKPLDEAASPKVTEQHATDWNAMGRLAVTMLQEAGIECVFYTNSDDDCGYKYSDFE